MIRKVAVIMGSDSDWPVVKGACAQLKALDIPFEAHILSAHRTPAEAAEFAKNARANGFGVILCAAGMAAHLAGAFAANTTLPVIGIPMKGGAMDGLDALLATVQMPSGIPVATVALNGAKNAAWLAAEILALSDDALAGKLEAERVDVGGIDRVGGVRTLGLEPDVGLVLGAEGVEQGHVPIGRLLERAEDEGRASVAADGNLDLRHALADRELGNELAHRHDHVGDVLREDVAARHFGDVGGGLLMEADEHAALLGDVADRQAGAVTVVPERTVDRRDDLFGTNAADVPERVDERALLVSDLGAWLKVLHGAAAAAAGTVAELGATGLDALNALAVNLGDAADLEAGLVADALVGDELARKGALDEDDLAVVMTHAAAFLVEALHLDGEVFGGFLFASCHDS